MNKFIVNSTAALPLGLPTGRKCLIIKSGPQAGRMAILYAASASNIALVRADPPYDNFSTPVNVVTDAADSPFDACINDDGDIYIAYTVAAGFNLGFVKLSFATGDWTAGTPVIVYDAEPSYFPSIIRLAINYLWIAYTRVSGGVTYISAKSSTSEGESWGTASNPGDTLTLGSTSAYAVMVQTGDYQYVFYSEGGSKIAYRRKLHSAVIWNSEVTLATGDGFDENLAAAVDIDSRIGLAYASSSGLKFREFSGSGWSVESILDSHAVSGPAVSYQGGIPYVIFNRVYGEDMNLVMYTKRIETSFQSPMPLDARKSYLQRLLVYDASAGTYQDKTAAASSTDSADVYHSSSGALVSATGDAVFAGLEEPFHFLNVILSTAGAGGEIIWKYWDGQTWKSFTPVSGAWHFSTNGHALLLWNDYRSIPIDWQKKTVSGDNLYWISATVASPFSTPPVGTQVSSISNLKALSVQV
jgi:hypothetical protein